MANEPEVSVVIPTYNRAPETLGRALDSVLSQEGVDFEIIVVDDASDMSQQEMRERCEQESRISWIQHEDNRGGGAARVTGVEAASAPLIAFLDSDDWWLPGKLAKNLEMAPPIDERDPWLLFNLVEILTARGSRISSAIEPTPRIGEYLFIHRGQVQTSSVLVPRWLVTQVPFDSSLQRLQDWDLYLRLGEVGTRFILQPEVLSVYDARAETGRISSTLDPDSLLGWLEEHSQFLNEREIAGFMANKVAPEMVRQRRRGQAAQFLWDAARRGSIGPRYLFIETLRMLLPAEGFATIHRIWAKRPRI